MMWFDPIPPIPPLDQIPPEVEIAGKLIAFLTAATGVLAWAAREWAKRGDHHYSDAMELRRVQDERIDDLSRRLSLEEEARQRCEDRHERIERESVAREQRISNLERSNEQLDRDNQELRHRLDDLIRLIDRRRHGEET